MRADPRASRSPSRAEGRSSCGAPSTGQTWRGPPAALAAGGGLQKRTSDLNAGDFSSGVQLLLPLYLRTALDLAGDALPAGCFYQPLRDPVVRADTAEEALKEGREQLRLRGVALADPLVLRLMDGAEPPISLPGYVKRDGGLRENDRLLSQEGLRRLMEMAQEKAGKLAADMLSGDVSRSPLVRTSGRAECGFCSHRGVCRSEKLSREQRVRRSPRTQFAGLTGG